MAINLWHRSHLDGAPNEQTLDAPLSLGDDRATNANAAQEAVRIFPTSQVEYIAAALIPETLRDVVRHNRTAVSAGLLPLRHGDQIEVGAQSFWFASGSAAELTDYQSSQHGSDVFCFLTKARLGDGEPIAICPGTATQGCGTIYKLSAWQAMLTQDNFRCASCGFDPNQPAWQPPPRRDDKRIDQLFALLEQGVKE